MKKQRCNSSAIRNPARSENKIQLRHGLSRHGCQGCQNSLMSRVKRGSQSRGSAATSAPPAILHTEGIAGVQETLWEQPHQESFAQSRARLALACSGMTAEHATF